MHFMLSYFILLITVMTTLACSVVGENSTLPESFSFDPFTRSARTNSMPACTPLLLPHGYHQSILVQELPFCSNAMVTLDVIAETNDRTDMNAVNETGEEIGRYLYRTHETGEGKAAISVIDLKTGQTARHSGEQFGGWNRLDGIEWTPWGTVLVAEEAGAHGRLFECHVDGLHLACVDRPAVGRMSHEGIAATKEGTIYVIDEYNGGSIFKFVPTIYGNLSAGKLFALNITSGEATICSGKAGVGFTPTGKAEWILLTPGQNRVVTDPAYNARSAASEAHVTKFCRPEDIEVIDENLYVSTTTTHTVFQIPLTTETPIVTEYVGINTNMNSESEVPSYGLHSPDNLASDRAGNLYIVEDNAGKSDIWVATPDKNQDGVADSVRLFATLTTYGAEGSGIYILPAATNTILFNVQHAYNENDMTLSITKGFAKK